MIGPPLNLLYIRAAIREATGVVLTQEQVLAYLVEEGLVTPLEAQDESLIFRGYDQYFGTDYAEVDVEFLPDLAAPDEDE